MQIEWQYQNEWLKTDDAKPEMKIDAKALLSQTNKLVRYNKILENVYASKRWKSYWFFGLQLSIVMSW